MLFDIFVNQQLMRIAEKSMKKVFRVFGGYV